ncbi:MAG: lipoyl(octanoyl) transferase LipB [Acidobacteriales bacterium]|nr:lipoyl(octanoyl) transferase LipB [Terriglobales bacterium]
MINVLHLGLLDYATALELQHTLVELRKQNRIGDTLLLLEHPAVITLGRNADAKNILASKEQLAARGVEVSECDRGGDVTLHGPGQLVGYPIFDLRGFTPKLGAVDFVRKVEEALIRACGDLGVPAERVTGLTGVWTSTTTPAKIAAIGVHISRGVTSHGFALNVNNDLSLFDLIVPCGISDKRVTSLQHELSALRDLNPGEEFSIEAVANAVSRNFGRIFERQTLWLENLETLLGSATPQDTPMKPPAELRALHEEDIFLA